VLGEIGRGHKIAFNILNIGRWKLGIGSTGGAKAALGHGVRYAKERKQFKKPIATFGLIRQKIASSATLIYAVETMAYRLAGMLDDRLATVDKGAEDAAKQVQNIIEDFTIEASVLKVVGSETLGYVADEMLQVFGGYGYSEEYPLERIYRDARINRIFEGTNEINRLIVPATLLKRALKGQAPLMEMTQKIIGELADPEQLPKLGEGPLAKAIFGTEMAKRAVVFAASYAAQKYMQDLKDKQRILGSLADCLNDLYGMDSVIARAHQAVAAQGEAKAELHTMLASLFCFEARANVFQRLRRIAMMMAEGAELDTLYENLAKLDQRNRVDYTGLQDAVAERMLDADGYALG
jgi:alkylation response protein AidB-like acyl-CoA dehydrogenase